MASLRREKKIVKLKNKIELMEKKQAKGFWNDRDGWSITDVMSIGFATLFAVVSFMMFIKLWTDELTMQSIDFFQVFSYPMLIILSGYFGDKIVGNLGAKRNFRKKESTTISSPTSEYIESTEEVIVPEEYVYENESMK